MRRVKGILHLVNWYATVSSLKETMERVKRYLSEGRQESP